MDHLYKSQLQAYALKQNLDLPVYATEREGPPHALRFRSKVTFCGQTFQSQDFYPTLKTAEHAAAKLALASFASLSPESIDIAYKNLLQEIAQKENSLLPVYATATSGPSHAPTFITTLEFAGKHFRGEEAKTKKLAEMSAAKVAYMSIKYGNMNQPSSPSLPSENQETANSKVKINLQEIPSQPSKIVTPDVQSKWIELPCGKQETANSKVKSNLQEIPSQPPKIATPDVPSKWIEVYEDELPDFISASASNDKEVNVAASPVPENRTSDGTRNTPATNAMETSFGASSSPMPQNPTSNGNETSLCVEESEKKLIMGTGHVSIPTGQHVVCRPWNPEMPLPEGAELLFRDDRFIAYRLVKP